MKLPIPHQALVATVLFTMLSAAALAAPQGAAETAVTPSVAMIAPSALTTLHEPVALSRAEVKAEARQAERAGLIPRGQANYRGWDTTTRSTLDRATVKAETRLAMAQGLIPRGEAAPRVLTADSGAQLSRAEVKAEARFAEQNGLIQRGEANRNRF